MKTVQKFPYQVAIGDKIQFEGNVETVRGVKTMGKLTGAYEIATDNGREIVCLGKQKISVIAKGASK